MNLQGDYYQTHFTDDVTKVRGMTFPREYGTTSKQWNYNFNSVLAVVKTHASLPWKGMESNTEDLKNN